jgi:hypothetical protein
LQPKLTSKASEMTTTGLIQLGADLNSCVRTIDLTLSSRGLALSIGAKKQCLSSIGINSLIAAEHRNLHAMTIIRLKHPINTYQHPLYQRLNRISVDR